MKLNELKMTLGKKLVCYLIKRI